MLLFFFTSVAMLITEGPDLESVAGMVIFLPPGLLALFGCFTSRPAIVIDDRGIRSPVYGWDVLWEEVDRAELRRLPTSYVTTKTLVFYVRDPGAVVRRMPARRRSGSKGPRVERAIARNGARFALHYLDTPRDEILAAVERRVPVER